MSAARSGIDDDHAAALSFFDLCLQHAYFPPGFGITRFARTLHATEKLLAQVMSPHWRFYYIWGRLRVAPRFLSCLRIKHIVTDMPARLDTRLVASDYPDGIHTR